MSVRAIREDSWSTTEVAELYRSDTNQPAVLVRERGRITVTYRFSDGRAIVTSSKYEPYEQ